jgi:hypothetical protein
MAPSVSGWKPLSLQFKFWLENRLTGTFQGQKLDAIKLTKEGAIGSLIS